MHKHGYDVLALGHIWRSGARGSLTEGNREISPQEQRGFSSPPLDRNIGQDPQTTPVHQIWPRARFNLQNEGNRIVRGDVRF
jgi:hypothetical protein